jgi:hypothetical protein
VISPSDLSPVSEDTARRVLAVARSIAPCLDSLTDGAGEQDPKPRSDAIAILKAVGNIGAARGSQLVKSQRVGPAAVEYNVGSWFSDDDRAALRGLCSELSTDSSGHPVGQFPASSKLVSRMWPEEQC